MNYSFKIRFVTSTKNHFYVMAEMPPHERMMFAYGHRGLRVSLPWMVFVVSISRIPKGFIPNCLYTYFRKSSLDSVRCRLTVPSLSNTASSGYVCLGGHPSRLLLYDGIEEAVASQINAYFSTRFLSRTGLKDIPDMQLSGYPLSHYFPILKMRWREWTPQERERLSADT
jgi:hypothetical protein